jgi:hypothetical protein
MARRAREPARPPRVDAPGLRLPVRADDQGPRTDLDGRCAGLATPGSDGRHGAVHTTAPLDGAPDDNLTRDAHRARWAWYAVPAEIVAPTACAHLTRISLKTIVGLASALAGADPATVRAS